MNNIDDLLREFRADVPEPPEDAAHRIMARARGAHSNGDAQPQRSPQTRSTRGRLRRWAAVPVAGAVAASILLAVAPWREGAGTPTLLERAEAAITPANRIVSLSLQIHSTTTAAGVVNPNQTIRMRQWTLAGAERAMLSRMLITEGPLQRPPTDEDTTVLTDRHGRIVDQRSWTPLFVRARDNYNYPSGGGRGQLEIGGPPGVVAGGVSIVQQLRDAYRRGRLRLRGRTADGHLRFTGTIIAPGGTVLSSDDSTGCTNTEFILDARTLFPRRLVTTTKRPPCRPGARTLAREVWTISQVRSLRATPTNRRLLQIGPWPTDRIVRWTGRGKPTPIDDAPPVPPLDER